MESVLLEAPFSIVHIEKVHCGFLNGFSNWRDVQLGIFARLCASETNNKIMPSRISGR